MFIFYINFIDKVVDCTLTKKIVIVDRMRDGRDLSDTEETMCRSDVEIKEEIDILERVTKIDN